MFDDFELMVEPPEALGEKFGETYPDRHIIRLREDIYDEAVSGDGFARMTLAHEVGHLFEHGDIPLSLAHRPASGRLPAYRSSEWQANAFAGALLMPACKIVHMDAASIAGRYQVTTAAAKIQREKIMKEACDWELPRL